MLVIVPLAINDGRLAENRTVLPAFALIYAEVKPTSIHLPNPKMESSARQAPYLDTEQFPLASFMSHEMRKLETGGYQLEGDWKINGIEKKQLLACHSMDLPIREKSPFADLQP